MANRVNFNNSSNYAAYEEIGPVNNLILKIPPQFDNGYDDHAKVVLLDTYCMLWPDAVVKDSKPVMYFRHTDVANNKYRFGNIVDLGDKPLDVQKGVLHADEAADASTPIDEPYGIVNNNPEVLGLSSKGKVTQRYYRDKVTVKEGDYLDLTAYPWEGFTVYDHQSTYADCSCVFQPSTFFGTLDGKPILGLGSFDRLCMKQHTSGGFGTVPLAYIAFSAMGIRPDGRKEMVFASIGLNDGARTIATYHLEGETPIISDSVDIEADWVHLPYVNDGTCVFKDASIYFGGKEFHFKGKWGTKGFLRKPRIEKHGQSQMFGSWYEGNTEYEHRLYYTFVESMEAYDENLKKLGFNIID